MIGLRSISSRKCFSCMWRNKCWFRETRACCLDDWFMAFIISRDSFSELSPQLIVQFCQRNIIVSQIKTASQYSLPVLKIYNTSYLLALNIGTRPKLTIIYKSSVPACEHEAVVKKTRVSKYLSLDEGFHAITSIESTRLPSRFWSWRFLTCDTFT